MSRPDSDATVAAAVAALRRGELVGLPTETVYGLAGDAADPAAVQRIYALKRRPTEHPVIVHLGDATQLDDWAREVPAAARTLAARFWPGPLTLILRRGARVTDLITGGQDTVGLRVPAHPLALAVLGAFGGGLAAPSANRYGHVSPTTAQHVREEFGDELPLVLDGGPCAVGIESTIVDLSGELPRVLRPGQIGVEAISAALGGAVATGAAHSSPRVPGALRSHYAPRAPAELVARAELLVRAERCRSEDEHAQLLAIGTLPEGGEGLALPTDPAAYARHLYAALRQLDAEGADRILIEAPPADAAWNAIRDRVQRATAGTPAGDADDAP
jgi:L-threonylcarbamoyladenylate synthase